MKIGYPTAVRCVAVAMAAVLLLGCNDQPEPSAQEDVERACADMAGLDSYDSVAITEGEDNGEPAFLGWKTEARVSGDDFHRIQTFDVEEGEGLVERIRVGDVTYYREAAYDRRPEYDWRVMDSDPSGGILSPLAELGSTPMCPDVRNLRLKGNEELDGVMTTVYQYGDIYDVEKDALQSLDISFEGVRSAIKHEYWVGEDGLLVQHEMDNYVVAVYDGDRYTIRSFSQTKFSGIGEPNTITAPTVP